MVISIIIFLIMREPLFSIFNNFPDLIIALSEKKDGSMKLSAKPQENEIVLESRRSFLNKLKIKEDKTINAGLLHGNNIKIVGLKEAGKKINGADGLLTGDNNIFLSLTVADCLPVFIFDPQKNIVGLIHGGWRGLVRNILSRAIEKMVDSFASDPKNILAGIGPGISSCHFEIKEDVSDYFKNFPPEFLSKEKGKIFADLKKIAEFQLIKAGLDKKNIEINLDCAYCLSEKYFSFRRDGKNNFKTMLAIMGRI